MKFPGEGTGTVALFPPGSPHHTHTAPHSLARSGALPQASGRVKSRLQGGLGQLAVLGCSRLISHSFVKSVLQLQFIRRRRPWCGTIPHAAALPPVILTPITSPIPTVCPHLSVMPSRCCNDSQTEGLVTASTRSAQSEQAALHFTADQPQQWVSEMQIPKLLLLVTGL